MKKLKVRKLDKPINDKEFCVLKGIHIMGCFETKAKANDYIDTKKKETVNANIQK